MRKDVPAPTLKHPDWAMVAIVLLAGLVRLFALAWQSFWYDEAFAVAIGSATWPVLFQARLVDGIHPPLFFMLMKIGLSMWGITEFGARFLAAGAGVLAIPLIYRLGKVMFNRPTALLAAVLLALSPIHVWLSQEARMYSLLILVVMGSMLFFWQALQTNQMRYWLGLLVMNGLAFNLHYFGLWLPVIQLALLLSNLSRYVKQFRCWVVTQFLAGLFLLPWLIATALRESQSFGIGFLARPTLLDLPLTLWNFATGLSTHLLWPISILALALFVMAALNGLRRRQKKFYLSQQVLIFWIFLPLILVWIISQRRSFYSDRYLSFVIPALVLLVAFGATRLRSSVWRRVLAAGLIIASGYSLVNSRSDPAFFKDDWRAAVAYLARNEQAGDVILLYNSHLDIPFGYYYQGQLPRQPVTRVLDRFAIEPLVAGYRRAWVVYHYGRPPTHYPRQPLRPNGYWAEDPDRNPLLADWLEAQANQVLDYHHFRGLELWLVTTSTDSE